MVFFQQVETCAPDLVDDDAEIIVRAEWKDALTFEDQGNQAGLDAITPEIIQWDRGVSDADQFSRELKSGYQGLVDIRAEYGLPLSCD